MPDYFPIVNPELSHRPLPTYPQTIPPTHKSYWGGIRVELPPNLCLPTKPAIHRGAVGCNYNRTTSVNYIGLNETTGPKLAKKYVWIGVVENGAPSSPLK